MVSEGPVSSEVAVPKCGGGFHIRLLLTANRTSVRSGLARRDRKVTRQGPATDMMARACSSLARAPNGEASRSPRLVSPGLLHGRPGWSARVGESCETGDLGEGDIPVAEQPEVVAVSGQGVHAVADICRGQEKLLCSGEEDVVDGRAWRW